ncbi:hypothetical protein J6590_013020 [Homalodisca vitripennis]|nr:hypothetical protein J6590_013020 [Homalodisca vitripennis]
MILKMNEQRERGEYKRADKSWLDEWRHLLAEIRTIEHGAELFTPDRLQCTVYRWYTTTTLLTTQHFRLRVHSGAK